MNLIVTGKVKTGKTTWCTKYSQWLLQRKFTVGGILCPEARSNNIRIGYNIVDVQTNQSVPFARVTSEAAFPGEPVGNYLISYEGLEFANRAIKNALENRCDMVFIDEVGHLELAGKGTIESVRTAYRKAPNTTIVVRESLLGRFFEYFYLIDSSIGFSIKDLELDTTYPPFGGNAQCSTPLFQRRDGNGKADIAVLGFETGRTIVEVVEVIEKRRIESKYLASPVHSRVRS